MAQKPGGEDHQREPQAARATGELHERLSVTKGRRRDADARCGAIHQRETRSDTSNVSRGGDIKISRRHRDTSADSRRHYNFSGEPETSRYCGDIKISRRHRDIAETSRHRGDIKRSRRHRDIAETSRYRGDIEISRRHRDIAETSRYRGDIEISRRHRDIAETSRHRGDIKRSRRHRVIAKTALYEAKKCGNRLKTSLIRWRSAKMESETTLRRSGIGRRGI